LEARTRKFLFLTSIGDWAIVPNSWVKVLSVLGGVLDWSILGGPMGMGGISWKGILTLKIANLEHFKSKGSVGFKP
jgi:hypothetical protein